MSKYKCTYCNKLFTTNSNMNKHMKNVCKNKNIELIQLKLENEKLKLENDNLKLINSIINEKLEKLEKLEKIEEKLEKLEKIEEKLENLEDKYKNLIIEKQEININYIENQYINNIDLYDIMSQRYSEEETKKFFLNIFPKTKDLNYPLHTLIDKTGPYCPIKVNDNDEFELYKDKNNFIIDPEGKNLTFNCIKWCKHAYNKTYFIQSESYVCDINENPERHQETILNGIIGILPTLSEKTKFIETINSFKISKQEINKIKKKLKKF